MLSRAAEHGLSPDEARALLDTLHAAGFVLPAAALSGGEAVWSAKPTALALHRNPLPAPPCRRALAGRIVSAHAPVRRVPRSLAGGRPRPAYRWPRHWRSWARGHFARPDPAPPGAARVVITGHGRLGAPVAVALAEAGVGHVQPDLPGPVTVAELAGGPLRGKDVGRTRGEAVASALVRATPTIETRRVRRGAAALVIQLGYDQPVALLAAAHAAGGSHTLRWPSARGSPWSARSSQPPARPA